MPKIEDVDVEAHLHRAAMSPGWYRRNVEEPVKRGDFGSGNTVGYNDRRYKRVFNPQTARHEWWEVEKIGNYELTPDQRNDSLWGLVGVTPRTPKLKFIKRVPNSMVAKLWEARSEKHEKYARFWEAVQQAKLAGLPLPKWGE